MVVVLQFESLVHVAEDLAQVLDLLVVVGGGDLDPEPDLVLGHEGYAAIVT